MKGDAASREAELTLEPLDKSVLMVLAAKQARSSFLPLLLLDNVIHYSNFFLPLQECFLKEIYGSNIITIHVIKLRCGVCNINF